MNPIPADLRTSVRTKLLALALLPLLLVFGVLLGLLLYWGNAYYDRLLIFKVNSDLAVADQFFNRVTERIGRDIQSLAQSHALALSLTKGGAKPQLARLLAEQQAALKLDFLRFLSEPASDGDWPVVRSAWNGYGKTAIDIYSVVQLADIAPSLARRARLELVATPNTAPTTRHDESRGMMIHTAIPVFDGDGRRLGVLEGGVLLNQNLDFVDTINSLVYRPGALLADSHGTATLFLDDVRIATNVRLFEGRRALGTRVSQAVRERVLGRGETWLDRAFVVKDWYISAYQPIQDSRGERVGMLYVGFLEAPFQAVKARALAIILLLFLGVGALGGWLFWRWARTVFQPLERMNATISKVESGDLGARTGTVDSDDEIGRVAHHLDELLGQLQQRNRELAAWAEELDGKVADRTRDLEESNRLLRETQRQLVMSGKLAAIGEITAGVAHEINNPVAVIQGNLDLMRELLGPAAAPVREEIRLINQQIQRIQQIVTKLLQFARPAEYAGYVETVDVNALLDDTLVLVRHLLAKGNVAVAHEAHASRTVSINSNELQQVLINLLANAIHAMPTGGVLTLATQDWEDKGVIVTVRDSGVGIAPEHLARIFDPFFTTKNEQGTGLGLSISYTLLARYGGTIGVESAVGQGTTFTIRLLAEPLFESVDPVL